MVLATCLFPETGCPACGGDGGECVEVAAGTTAIRVRDSKERGGPRLAFTRRAWSGFVADLGRDRV
ncbi:DUF397 domain-containing protein [Streptomyces sp. GD-15H]|uniref:DUF397 domain-containing protein n=1 Tax=Streptomyces sp. GD-15H TaxID=3129112 RepID=UPI0032463CBF